MPLNCILIVRQENIFNAAFYGVFLHLSLLIIWIVVSPPMQFLKQSNINNSYLHNLIYTRLMDMHLANVWKMGFVDQK